MLFLVLACSDEPATRSGTDARSDRPHPAQLTRVANAQPTPVDGIPVQITASGLKSWTLKEGSGAAPTPGQEVGVEYTGWLTSGGSKFDSSLDSGNLLRFPVGMGRVIRGWDEGILLMKVGEKRQFEIPAELAYGDRGAGGVIPPGASLTFDIELVELGG
jgi:peptidylprolyl isomerase